MNNLGMMHHKIIQIHKPKPANI